MGPGIKFGTDGWRAVIADEFTFDNVRLVSLAIGKFLSGNSPSKKALFIGYDNRFLSENFAVISGETLSGMGHRVLISKNPVPTPVTAFTVRDLGLDGAIMITASHNPPIYNGIKFIPDYGGPASDKITAEIENNLLDVTKTNNTVRQGKDMLDNNGTIEYIEDFNNYRQAVLKLLDRDLIVKSKLKVVVDTMHGAGSKILPDIINNDLGIGAKILNDTRDPLFGGRLPDPSAANLEELKKELLANKLDIGIALDGDADRFGVIDGNGVFLSPNNVISMLLHYLIRTRKYEARDRVVRTIATTHLIDAICSAHNIEVIEKPVGFKYIGKEMLNEDIIIGGEESGGLSIKGHIPEKDGLLAGLLLLEIQSFLKNKKNNYYLSDYMDEIYREYGTFHNTRLDIHIPMEKKDKIIDYFLRLDSKDINGKKVVDVSKLDGTRLLIEDGSWILVRPSGTEPLIRCYIESTNGQYFKGLNIYVKQIINKLIK